MKNILAKELKIKFVETLNELEDFSYEEGNPFLVTIGVESYFVFLKNLSSASFKAYPDVTRVQLPRTERFSKIATQNIPFIILGYDVDNDIIVSWNPNKVKDRLNAKSNVSLYSRESLQSNVTDNGFKAGYLSNGEKIILFKREVLISFFDKLPQLFLTPNSTDKDFATEPKSIRATDKLIEIKDKDLLDEIVPLLKKNKVLEVVEICSNYYKNKYKSMTFKELYNIVNELYKKIKE